MYSQFFQSSTADINEIDEEYDGYDVVDDYQLELKALQPDKDNLENDVEIIEEEEMEIQIDEDEFQEVDDNDIIFGNGFQKNKAVEEENEFEEDDDYDPMREEKQKLAHVVKTIHSKFDFDD